MADPGHADSTAQTAGDADGQEDVLAIIRQLIAEELGNGPAALRREATEPEPGDGASAAAAGGPEGGPSGNGALPAEPDAEPASALGDRLREAAEEAAAEGGVAPFVHEERGSDGGKGMRAAASIRQPLVLTPAFRVADEALPAGEPAEGPSPEGSLLEGRSAGASSFGEEAAEAPSPETPPSEDPAGEPPSEALADVPSSEDLPPGEMRSRAPLHGEKAVPAAADDTAEDAGERAEAPGSAANETWHDGGSTAEGGPREKAGPARAEPGEAAPSSDSTFGQEERVVAAGAAHVAVAGSGPEDGTAAPGDDADRSAAGPVAGGSVDPAGGSEATAEGAAGASGEREGEAATAGSAVDAGEALDREALRPLVAALVREELMGELGDRITRNVRKLVRREINRILASRDFE